MKSLAACLFLLFFMQRSNAQNDPAAVNFIRSVVEEKNVVYTDSLGYCDAAGMKKALSDELAGHYEIMGNNVGIGSFHLTTQETNYIYSRLDLLGSSVWKPGILEKSTLISKDTVTKIFHRSDIPGWTYFYQHYGMRLYSFGKPIFLRNNTICIFYFGYGCGDLCGFGSLCIYIKENGCWKNKYTIYSWIS